MTAVDRRHPDWLETDFFNTIDPLRTLNLRPGNRSSCPKAAVTTGEASRLRRQYPQTGHPLRRHGIEKHIQRRDLAIADDYHIQARVIGRLAGRP